MSYGAMKPATSPLFSKVERAASLSLEDRGLFREAMTVRSRKVAAGEDFVVEGEPVEGLQIVVAGWATRYKLLNDGRRQIVALFLPGDAFDHDAALLGRIDHSIAALTAVTIAEIPKDILAAIIADHPQLALALRRENAVAAAVQREWMLNLGLRSTLERTAHLFCELSCRLRAVGLEVGGGYHVPLTQADLASLLGVSTVHINRTLMELRARGLIRLHSRHLAIPDFAALADLALFDPAYLYL